MATAPKNVWTNFAVLVPTTPKMKKDGTPEEWKVQVNQEGVFRCSCPSYIFSRVMPRTCKHCRYCEEQRISGGFKEGPGMTGLAAQVQAAPLLADAQKIFAAMVAAAQVQAKWNVLTHIGKESCEAMTAALAAKLSTFNRPALPVVAAEVTMGIRRITFDD